MPRRYVYWRKPDGRPYKGTDNKHACEAILARFGELASVNRGGKASLSAFHLLHEPVLRSSLVIVDDNGAELNEQNTWGIISKALRDVIEDLGGDTPIPVNELFKAVNRLAAAFYRQDVEEYVLLTSMSIGSLPAKIISINGCKVSPVKSLKKYEMPSAVNQSTEATNMYQEWCKSKYQNVKVKTRGRSIFEAADNALDALNLLRGLWTFLSTYGNWRIGFGSLSPNKIGHVHLGPLHTLHRIDGSPADNLFWYDPNHTGLKKLYEPSGGWERIEKQRRNAQKKIVAFDYKLELERLFMRYALALDHSTLDTTFVQFWSLLEKITDTVGGKYEETIDRASWIYVYPKIEKEKLNSIRTRRNQIVHAAKSSSDSDQASYQVKQYVDAHLNNLINNIAKVKSISEYGKFLSLPANHESLKSMQDRCKLAIKLRNPKLTP